MKKILILEDEEVLGRVYKKKLEEAGFEVVWVKTVEETETLIHSYAADILLLDHGIRGYEKAGIDLIPLLRTVLPHSKIIMLSNYSDFQMQVKALEKGADDYLVKINTHPRELVRRIQALFSPRV